MKRFYGLHRIFWCNSSTTRPHTWVLPVSTMQKSHSHTLTWHWYNHPPNLTQVKYHQITRKNSACWQMNTSRLFSYARHYLSSQMRSHTVGIPAYTLFSHQKVLAGVKVHQQFCSHLIVLTPRSLFLRPKT